MTAPGTREQLIDSAISFVRRQGYAGFSYAHLAHAIGIRKPSVHHHFATKEDLGVELVSTYTERIAERLAEFDAKIPQPLARVKAYSTLYREGLAQGQGCLCGVLAAERATLPALIQARVEEFFALNLHWLEQTLTQRTGLRASVKPSRESRVVLAVMQGAMFTALAMNDVAVFDDAVEGLLATLRDARHPS